MQYMFPERMNLNHSNAYPRGIPGLQKAHYKYKLDYTGVSIFEDQKTIYFIP